MKEAIDKLEAFISEARKWAAEREALTVVYVKSLGLDMDNARLRAALIEARHDIHHEFCTGDHDSIGCRDATAALGPDAPPLESVYRDV